MALKIGNNAVANAFVGSSQVRRAYKGGSLVFQAFSPASEQEFIEQTAAGGPAQLLKVYGKSVIWRQLVKNGDFSNGTTNWQSGNSSISATNGVLTWTAANSLSHANIVQANTGFVNGRKYYVSFIIKGSQAAKVNFALGPTSGGGYTSNFDYDTEWAQIRAIVNPLTASDQYFYIRPNAGGLADHIAYFKGPVVIIDLTDYFGAGNEPTTAAEAEQLLGNYDPTYDPGSLQSNKTSLLRAYDGGTLRGSLALNLATLTSGGVVVFPDGLRGVAGIRDEAYGSTGVVARAVVDLGSLTWYYSTSASLGAHFYAAFSPAAINRNNAVLSICAKYQCVTASSRYSTQDDKVIAIEDGTRVRIWDSAYTDPATFKAAMSGVLLDYPLATPLTYTLDTPLPTDLTCEQGDILQRVSDNNCPFVGEMRFGL